MENLTIVTPPPMPLGIGPRYKYQDVVGRIRAGAGEWVKVGLEEMTGDSKAVKQSRLAQAGRQRNIRITSTFRFPGVIYARVMTAAEMGPR
jgi:hypothetical protein